MRYHTQLSDVKNLNQEKTEAIGYVDAASMFQEFSGLDLDLFTKTQVMSFNMSLMVAWSRQEDRDP